MNSITITYLSKVSFASLNGADKEVDNINPIKKITLSNGEELPYVSSQALRRALRDRLKELGFELSPVQKPKDKKGATTTSLDPKKYIDDDLFGYMKASSGDGGAKGVSDTRPSPIRVEALLALTDYKGDLDYATNFMGKEIGSDPNIFETEIHSGIYRGTILIELDRIGRDNQKKEGEEDFIDDKKKSERVLGFLSAFRNLWSSGRQSRFLADISPKFIAAGYMKAKNPIFLEAVSVSKDGKINYDKLKTVITDYDKFLTDHVFAAQEAVFELSDGVVGLKAGFDKIESWIKEYYKS